MPVTRGQKRESEMEAALRTFFSSPRFAVAGASSDPAKYGHKSKSHCFYSHPTLLTTSTVFAWYLRHSLPATPINPRSSSVNILKRDHDTVPSPTALQDPSSYSLSVITPPAVTRQLLKEAKEAGIPAVWLQPGSFDKEVLEYAQANFKAAIGGDGGGGSEGWCVLVDGEEGLRLAEREWSRL
jgi:predicted CoA-binding protein